MSNKFKQREISPDYKYDSVVVAKFINQVMKQGKKTVAQKIVYKAFDIVQQQTKQDPLDVFEKAIAVVGPRVEVKPRRVGGATYQVPIEVSDKRKIALAFRWIIAAAKAKKGKPMNERLAQELIDASKNGGEAVKKKINIEKMAAANKAFAYLAKRRR